ncbi:hypothetical protein VNO78_27696 [Psophocarpus tetragonolobus]|uniref:Transposase n=1 Tax=Psophocarpus tetragonolobus TaxID=3891 RepID=A0AAN9XBL0_PSOTE
MARRSDQYGVGSLDIPNANKRRNCPLVLSFSTLRIPFSPSSNTVLQSLQCKGSEVVGSQVKRDFSEAERRIEGSIEEVVSSLDMARLKSNASRKSTKGQLQMAQAEKDQNKEKASTSYGTRQHSRRLQQMNSQNPQSATSHTVSRHSDPPAWTADVTPTPSIQGDTPCTSQPTNSDAGRSPCTSDPPSRTSDVIPPSMQGVHSPCSSHQEHSDEERTFRSSVPLETNTNDGKPTLYLDGRGFLPSRPAAAGIGDIIQSNYTDPWPSWKKIPFSTRDSWFKEFLMKFSINPPDYNWAKKNFEMRGSILLTNRLNKGRITMCKPNWIKDDVWERLCEHWSSEGFKKKSAQAKANRASNFAASHTCGSISASQHRANMMKETGTTPTPLELFRRLHQRKDKTWVDRRSQQLNETFMLTMKHLTKKALVQGKPAPSELDVWCDVARSKRGKVYGLGMKSPVDAGRACYPDPSSSMEWVKKLEFDELRKEVEEVKNERDELEAKVANTERLIEHNNALIRELIENMNRQSMPPIYSKGKSRRG